MGRNPDRGQEPLTLVTCSHHLWLHNKSPQNAVAENSHLILFMIFKAGIQERLSWLVHLLFTSAGGGVGQTPSKVDSCHHVWCLGAPWTVSLSLPSPLHVELILQGLPMRSGLATAWCWQGSQTSLHGGRLLISQGSRRARGKLQGFSPASLEVAESFLPHPIDYEQVAEPALLPSAGLANSINTRLMVH